MTLKLRELTEKTEQFGSGHALCAGCAEPVAVRQVLAALVNPPVVALATGCLEVATTRFPDTTWKVPVIHSAFENAATTISGVEAAYKALVRKGRMEPRPLTFLVFGGDGATYDIGFQWLSGALERGHKFIYVCLNNEGYMNTGIQRSSATLLGAWTTTTPAGDVRPGKLQWHKDMTRIIAAHNIPYVAQAAVHNWKDLMTKVRKAEAADGPAFINVITPCDRGWRFDTDKTMEVSRLMVESGLWPLYEVENGVWRMTGGGQKRRPVIDALKSQKRFSHITTNGDESVVAEIQRRVDAEWESLQQLCEMSARAESES
ncbi:MAG: thiamine pyrophosphate-dependent enzyme [Chloroflexi bacterium]|nr:thiamine pyrophosphate-dependent enzyme [Chloroflexota bacterium]MDA1298301.1 thiamine pyrophosphate-dependent enzyme [Chloroflexota bacterium]